MPPPLCSFFNFPSLLPAKFNSVSPGPQLGLLAVYVRGEGRLAPRLCVRSGCIYICLALEPGTWNLELCAGASWTRPRRLQQDLWTNPQDPMNGSQSHTAVHAHLHHSPLFFFSTNVKSTRPSTITANNAADRLSAGQRKESAEALTVKVHWTVQ